MKSIVFFNNKGGVGKTTTVYHIAWMLSEMEQRVLAVDLDPQCTLSSMFLQPERMEEAVWEEDKQLTILNAIIPLSEGEGYQPVHIEHIHENISLLIGNLALSSFEDTLSDAWNKCLAGDAFAFNVSSVFKTLIDDAALRCNAEWVLIDVGPNLGAINRAVLLAATHVVMPMASDVFSLQGIKNIGKTLNEWHTQLSNRLAKLPAPDKSGIAWSYAQPLGYILMQYTARESRSARSYIRWTEKIPGAYREYVLNTAPGQIPLSIENDPNCLSVLKYYHSLAPMSIEAHKPIFLLKPSDGAIGAHVQAVLRSFQDFKALTERIIDLASNR